MKAPDKNSWSYKLGFRFGQIAAYTVFGCLLALLVAITIKVITLMF